MPESRAWVESAADEELLDRRLFNELRAALGPVAEQVLGETDAELGVRMERLGAMSAADFGAETADFAHEIVGLAAQVGMTAAARIARDLERCCLDGDAIAAHAVAGRLIHVTAESLRRLAAAG